MLSIHVMQKIIVVQKLCRSWTFGVVWTRKDARCPVSKDWCRVSLVKKNTWFAIGKFQSRMYFCQIHAVEVVHSFKCLKVCRYCRWFFFPTLCFSFLSTDGCILEITYTWMYFNCLFLLLVAVANRRWLQVVATIVALQWNLWWDVRWKHQ